MRQAWHELRTDTASRPEAGVARHWHTIVGHEFPDAVITDRSALTGVKVDGYLPRHGLAIV